MSLVFVKTKKNIDVERFFYQLEQRLKVIDPVKNPFQSNIKNKVLKDNLYFALDIEPIYPPAYLFFLFPLILGLVFGWAWLSLLGFGLFVIVGFFWTKLFYFMMIQIGLRKEGYKEKIVFVNNKEAWRVFVWDKTKF